jgi:redox-sensitive bicupin YhaK (pirin superfamily)
MTTRTIAQIETATDERVGAFKIKNVLPTRNLKQVDPFLLIHHLKPFVLEPGGEMRIPPHPHAGFEVVTYLIDGEFFHRDSKGHDQVGKAGDINWMTSGSGIVHSEGPAAELAKNGGKVQLMQIWINLPGESKSVAASFRNYPAAGFPVIEDDNSRVKVLMGSYQGENSPVQTRTPIFYDHIQLKAGTLFVLPVEAEYSAALYVMDGKIKILNEPLIAGQLAVFNTDGDQLVFSAVTDAEVSVFGGLPLKEEVVSYGPFVMNSLEEVQHAIGEYETGKMGSLDY